MESASADATNAALCAAGDFDFFSAASSFALSRAGSALIHFTHSSAKALSATAATAARGEAGAFAVVEDGLAAVTFFAEAFLAGAAAAGAGDLAAGTTAGRGETAACLTDELLARAREEGDDFFCRAKRFCFFTSCAVVEGHATHTHAHTHTKSILS